MNNKIIIDGFWRVGKTSVAKKLAQEFQYKIIKEPNHIDSNININIDEWYVAKHQDRLKKLFQDRGARMILERSPLASAAFLYATHQKLQVVDRIVQEFMLFYKRFRPLLVFMYADAQTIQNAAKVVDDPKLKLLLTKKFFVKSYDFFYRNLLPFQYGITPLCVNVSPQSPSAQFGDTINQAKEAIIKAMQENRVAQINLICYKMRKGEPLFLLLKRNSQKGGFWQGVTGGVKAGEILFDTLTRELREELSLKSKKEFLPSYFSFNYIGNEGYELNEYVFGCKLKWNEKIILSHEHTDYKLAPLEQCLPMLKYESNKKAISLIHFLIKNGKRPKSFPKCNH